MSDFLLNLVRRGAGLALDQPPVRPDVLPDATAFSAADDLTQPIGLAGDLASSEHSADAENLGGESSPVESRSSKNVSAPDASSGRAGPSQPESPAPGNAGPHWVTALSTDTANVVQRAPLEAPGPAVNVASGSPVADKGGVGNDASVDQSRSAAPFPRPQTVAGLAGETKDDLNRESVDPAAGESTRGSNLEPDQPSNTPATFDEQETLPVVAAPPAESSIANVEDNQQTIPRVGETSIHSPANESSQSILPPRPVELPAEKAKVQLELPQTSVPSGEIPSRPSIPADPPPPREVPSQSSVDEVFHQSVAPRFDQSSEPTEQQLPQSVSARATSDRSDAQGTASKHDTGDVKPKDLDTSSSVQQSRQEDVASEFAETIVHPRESVQHEVADQHSRSQNAAPPPASSVQVHIGSVEIRATTPVSDTPPQPRRSAQPLGFEEYRRLRGDTGDPRLLNP